MVTDGNAVGTNAANTFHGTDEGNSDAHTDDTAHADGTTSLYQQLLETNDAKQRLHESLHAEQQRSNELRKQLDNAKASLASEQEAKATLERQLRERDERAHALHTSVDEKERQRQRALQERDGAVREKNELVPKLRAAERRAEDAVEERERAEREIARLQEEVATVSATSTHEAVQGVTHNRSDAASTYATRGDTSIDTRNRASISMRDGTNSDSRHNQGERIKEDNAAQMQPVDASSYEALQQEVVTLHRKLQDEEARACEAEAAVEALQAQRHEQHGIGAQADVGIEADSSLQERVQRLELNQTRLIDELDDASTELDRLEQERNRLQQEVDELRNQQTTYR